MAKQGGYTPQPGARPGEAPLRTKPLTLGDKPTGTAVPERRSAKGDMGGVPGSVGFDVSVPDDAFNIRKPSRTDGYQPPGKPERGGP